MFIAVDVAGCMMGSEMFVSPDSDLWRRRRVSVRVAATTSIEAVEIVRNGDTVARAPNGGKYVELHFEDHERLPAVAAASESYGAFCYYYVRVRTVEGHFGWTSPVWLIARS